MEKSQYKTFTDIAKAVMRSGYGKDFVQKKRIYDMDNKTKYVDVYDEEATITRLCLTMERGAEIGIAPMQSLYSIVWYADRPCLYGDVVLALCKAHPEWEGTIEENNFETLDRSEWKSKTFVKRNGINHVGSFSWKDAVNAGLSRLPHYQEYGKRMLSIRSRVWALRDAFPDVLAGLSIAEEMKDFDLVTQLKASEKKVSETVSASASMDKFTQAAIAEKGEVKPDLEKSMSHKFEHDTEKSGITFNETVIDSEQDDLSLKIAAAKQGEAVEVTQDELKEIIEKGKPKNKRATRKKPVEKK